MHLKPSERSKHVPLFMHGDDWHSSMFISHKLPEKWEKKRKAHKKKKIRMRVVIEIPMPTNYKLKFSLHKESGIKKVKTNLKSLLSLRAIHLLVWNERRWIYILLGRKFLKIYWKLELTHTAKWAYFLSNLHEHERIKWKLLLK